MPRGGEEEEEIPWYTPAQRTTTGPLQSAIRQLITPAWWYFGALESTRQLDFCVAWGGTRECTLDPLAHPSLAQARPSQSGAIWTRQTEHL